MPTETQAPAGHTADRAAPAHTLVRALGLRDLVLFNIVAVLGLRWLATSAKAGPGAITLWILAAVLFFVPQGLAVIELSSRFPQEGGIYSWTKEALGEGHGFLCGWAYWVSNILYYPNLLISTAVIAAYVVGKGSSVAAESWTYVLTATLICLWVAVAFNVVGLGTGKWLQNLGGIGTYFPGVLLVVIAGVAIVTGRPSANVITARSLVPDFSNFANINLWASIAFAFAGLELSATMGDEVRDARRNLPRAIYVSAPLIALAYVLGTAAVLWLMPVAHLDIVSGFLQAIQQGTGGAGHVLWWLVPLAAAAYTVGNLGGVGAWLTGPARVAFVIGLDKYFPPAFGRVHPRWKTPWVAIVVQAALATVFLLLSVLGRGTTVERAYLVLLDTQLLVYFVPYVYLFTVFVMHRFRGGAGHGVLLAPGGRVGAVLIGGSGLAVTLFAMGVAMIPPGGEAPILFELKVVGGAGAFLLAGGALYWRAVSRTSRLP